MAKLTVQAITKAGIADLAGALAAAAALGDSADNSSGIFLVVQNADGGPHTVTVAAPVSSVVAGNLGSLDVDPLSLVVAAGDVGFLAIPTGYQNTDGDLAWTYDDETGMTVGVFSIAP